MKITQLCNAYFYKIVKSCLHTIKPEYNPNNNDIYTLNGHVFYEFKPPIKLYHFYERLPFGNEQQC